MITTLIYRTLIYPFFHVIYDRIAFKIRAEISKELLTVL